MTGLTDQQRLDWLRLIRSETIGPRRFRALVDRYGGAAAAIDALPEIAGRAGRSIRITSRREAEREMEAADRSGARFIASCDADYPRALLAIDSAPPLIAVRGQVAVLANPMIAIVGSRNASAAGLKFAGQLARAFGEAGFVVVSGLARGIDARAHEATRASGTVAVFAGGLDRLYPPEHGDLLRSILDAGAAISEMPFGHGPRGQDFPRRNRIVSGLSLGVVVVEAARRSGSLITARFALEQGREVFAVPGSPLDPRAEGTNDLIRQGATLCADPEHVVSVLLPLASGPVAAGRLNEGALTRSLAETWWDELDTDDGQEAPASGPAGDKAGHGLFSDPGRDIAPGEASAQVASRGRLLSLLGPTPIPVDDLVRLSGLGVREVLAVLLDLELAGRLERHGGQAVSLVS